MKNEELIIKKFFWFSEKHHKLSLLFYELGNTLKYKASKCKNFKEFKDYINSLNLDIDKIRGISKSVSDIELNNLKGGLKN